MDATGGDASRPASHADRRDAAADERDRVADQRDDLADAREHQLLAWERQLAERALRLGLLRAPSGQDEAGRAQAAAAREAAAQQRSLRAAERRKNQLDREAEALLRSGERRDTLLAAALADIAEYLHSAPTTEDLLTRIAESATEVVAGATSATVQTDPPEVGLAEAASAPEASLSFAFPPLAEAGLAGASLKVFAQDPAALDQAAADLGVILAAHAALAARAVGTRVQLEQLSGQLADALTSRDVIGQAKGILMERLRITAEEAFAILKRSSQDLNTKLREVARTVAETGSLEPRRMT